MELTGPDYVRLDNFHTLADLTQQVYLDLPPYYERIRQEFEKKKNKGKQ